MELISFESLMTVCMILFLLGSATITTHALYIGDQLSTKDPELESTLKTSYSEICVQASMLGVVALYAIIALPMMRYGMMTVASGLMLCVLCAFGMVNTTAIGAWLERGLDAFVDSSEEFWGHQPKLYVKVSLATMLGLYFVGMALLCMPSGLMSNICMLFTMAFFCLNAVFVSAPAMSESVEN